MADMASKWRVRKKRQKRHQFFLDLMEGLQDAIAYEKGLLPVERIVQCDGYVSIHIGTASADRKVIGNDVSK